MKVSKYGRSGETVQIWVNSQETYSWANRSGNSWPCSELSGKTVFVELHKGDLVDFAINGKTENVDATELNAFIEDMLEHTINVYSLEKGLAHGSGINGKWYISDMGQYFRCENIYATMTEYGYYDYDVSFQLIIPKHNPEDFKLHFQGRKSHYYANKYMLRDYLEDVFAEDIRTILKA